MKQKKKSPTFHRNMFHMYSTQWIETLQGDQLLKGDVFKKKKKLMEKKVFISSCLAENVGHSLKRFQR